MGFTSQLANQKPGAVDHCASVALVSFTAALMASSARMEQWVFHGGGAVPHNGAVLDAGGFVQGLA
jgi:hypothetical protein